MAHRLRSLATALACLLFGAAHAAPFAYIAHDGGVAVIDTAPHLVVDNLAIGGARRNTTSKPGGTRAYVVSDPIDVIDIRSQRVTLQLPSQQGYFMALSPADAKALVLENHCLDVPACTPVVETRLQFMDTDSRAPIRTTRWSSNVSAAVFHPDGDRVLLADPVGDQLVIMRVSDPGFAATIPLGGRPWGLFVDSVGARAYVALPNTNALRVINLLDNSTIATIPVGATPLRVVGSPDGARVYVTNSAGNSVSVIDTATNNVVATVPVAAGPEGIDITPNGRFVYVVAAGAGRVNVVSTENHAIVADLPIGGTLRATGRFIGGPNPEPPAGVGIYSGLWYNPAESGWGVHVTQRRNTIFAAWFTYGVGGNPHWYVSSNCALEPDPACPDCADRAICTGPLTETRGPEFFTGVPFDPSRVSRGDVGSFTIKFADRDHAQINYTLYGVPGAATMQRQVFAAGTPVGTNFTDLWWNPNESGWGMGITHQANIMFLTWFVYDSNTIPGWYVASRCEVTPDGRGCRGRVYRTVGPPGPRSPSGGFDASQVHLTDVGSIDVTFTDDNNAVISYVVNGFAASKTITRQVF